MLTLAINVVAGRGTVGSTSVPIDIQLLLRNKFRDSKSTSRLLKGLDLRMLYPSEG
jgi:hypothetical protein